MTRWLVVGGGAAGCVVASRLSERACDEVILLEAGPDHGPDPAPGDLGPVLDDPRRLRDTTVVRVPGSSPVPYPQGHGLGGSSLVNGAIVIGDPAADPTPHLLPLEEPWSIGPVGEALLAATPAARVVRLVRRERRRVTAADAYLRPVVHRENLRVVTDAPVVRIRLDGRRAVGAVTADGREWDADRVVACAGAIQTPALLLRSGVDTPGIGVGLQDHPACSIGLELRADAVDATAPSISVTANGRGGQVVAMDHLPGAAGTGALLPALLSVRSRGSVTLPDPEGPPRVELGGLSDPVDLDGMIGVVDEALHLLDHPALRRIVESSYADEHGTPTSVLVGDADRIRRWLPTRLTGHQHAASTCRVGTVTDERGAVVGYDGLVVCDASSFPGVPGPNPYLSVVQLAERMVGRWTPAGNPQRS